MVKAKAKVKEVVKRKIKLSATRINSFLQCKQRYYFSYVERVAKLPNPVFKLGLACHETLEKAGVMWQKESLQEFTEQQIADLLDYYDEMSVREGIQEYEDHTLGKSLVKSRLLNFKLGQRIVGVEDKFGFEGSQTLTTKDGIELIGAIDKTIAIDDRTLLIVDYKTSKSVPDGGKMRSDVQLSMYNLVAKKLYPGYDRIILSLDMLRTGEIVYTYRTDEELDEFEKYLSVIHKEMSAITEETAIPTLNFLCAWCDYTHICTKYKEACETREFAFLALDKMGDEDMMKEWDEVRSTKKLLEMRERALSDLMIEKIKIYDTNVNNGETEMVLRQMARTSYNPSKVAELISKEDFADLVNISPTKLRKYLDKNPKIRHLVDELSETNYTNAFLASRKIKKVKKTKSKKGVKK